MTHTDQLCIGLALVSFALILKIVRESLQKIDELKRKRRVYARAIAECEQAVQATSEEVKGLEAAIQPLKEDLELLQGEKTFHEQRFDMAISQSRHRHRKAPPLD